MENNLEAVGELPNVEIEIRPLTEEEKDRIALLVNGGLTESKPQWFGEYVEERIETKEGREIFDFQI